MLEEGAVWRDAAGWVARGLTKSPDAEEPGSAEARRAFGFFAPARQRTTTGVHGEKSNATRLLPSRRCATKVRDQAACYDCPK